MKDFFLGRGAIAKSKLAKRLVPLFVAVAIAPLAVTVFIVGRVGQVQIVDTAHTMRGISEQSVQDAGKEYQELGNATVQRSGNEIAAISLRATQDVSHRYERNQAASLVTTGNEFSQVTQKSFDSAMHESLRTNKQILGNVSAQMGSLFASSAHFTEGRVTARVQSAMLTQANTQMQERAQQLAQSVEDYILTNQNYLALTAQMINLYQGNESGQKAVLDALVRRMPMLTEVSVLDRNGKETAMSASDRIVTASDLTNCANTDYFKQSLTDQPYIAVDDFPSDGTPPTLRLAVPIEIYRGNVNGVLAARLSLSDLWDVISTTRIGKTGFAYVTTQSSQHNPNIRGAGQDLIKQSAEVDPMGWRLVVAEPRQEVMQPIESFKSDISKNTDWSLTQMHDYINSSSKVAAATLQAHQTNLRATMLSQVGSSTRSIFQRLQATTRHQTDAELARMQSAIRSQASRTRKQEDQAMVAAATTASNRVSKKLPGLTSDALHKAKNRLTFVAIVIIMASCVLSYVIAIFLTATLVKPIYELAAGTRAVAHGELDKRVDERAPGEIGDLAVAFNTMAQSLQKSRADLSDAEAQLVQSAKLASLGTLSAGVAHELNQPVAIVRGLAQQLRSEPDLSTFVQEDLALIERQTSRMMKIITHMRTFCRAGSAELNAVDVNQVVTDCFILIDAQLKSHEITVELDLCENPPTINGDTNELEQVFINLITNAKDALDGQENALIRIRSYAAHDKMIVEFADNGPGIPEKNTDHIFDPFFTTKEAGKGTGLGLSISHGIIEKHKGSITVKNDGGAIFTISLPIAEQFEKDVDQPRRLAA